MRWVHVNYSLHLIDHTITADANISFPCCHLLSVVVTSHPHYSGNKPETFPSLSIPMYLLLELLIYRVNSGVVYDAEQISRLFVAGGRETVRVQTQSQLLQMAAQLGN